MPIERALGRSRGDGPTVRRAGHLAARGHARRRQGDAWWSYLPDGQPRGNRCGTRAVLRCSCLTVLQMFLTKPPFKAALSFWQVSIRSLGTPTWAGVEGPSGHPPEPEWMRALIELIGET